MSDGIPCWDCEEGCLCILPKGHETPHVCECGGCYSKVGGDFRTYVLPPGTGYVSLTQEEAIKVANDALKRGPLTMEAPVGAMLDLDEREVHQGGANQEASDE